MYMNFHIYQFIFFTGSHKTQLGGIEPIFHFEILRQHNSYGKIIAVHAKMKVAYFNNKTNAPIKEDIYFPIFYLFHRKHGFRTIFKNMNTFG